MYFQSIDINNYGSIVDFHYQFRFDDNGCPIPLVLIGENGTGKTLTIANMVDALIELKRKTYGENLSEVTEHNFFKIGSKNYISIGKNSSCVKICLKHKKDILKYTDIMSNDPSKIAEDIFIESGDIANKSDFEDGFYKRTISPLKKKHYSEFITLYFPVDRFYLPLWYNNDNYKRIDYSEQANIDRPLTNIIKTDILSNIKDWLTFVYLEANYELVQIPDTPEIPIEMRGKQGQVSIDTFIQSLIKKVMNAILDSGDYKPKTANRKNRAVSFTLSGIACKDISQLSEGQINLFSIALSIIKEWDISHENFELSDISGCVIIDEADLGLHINYMHDCFPRMMRLFPNIQFVITTHSPFLIAGLSETYGENIDIVTMPEGVKIADINAFSEIQKAQKLLSAEINQIRESEKRLQKELENLRQMQSKIVLYTEGITDIILLNKALEKLAINDLPLEMHAASNVRGGHGDDAIKKLLETLQKNHCVNNTIIGLFDRDANPSVEVVDASGNKVKLIDNEFVKLGEHIYAFALPVPHNRTETDQISIEHYFTDEEIKTENENHQRLFLGKEFYISGNHILDTMDYNYRNARNYCNTIRIIEHEQNLFVTDRKGNGDFSLSKQYFAESIRDDREGFNQFCFSEFNKIFNIIRKIIVLEQSKAN